MPEVGKYHKIIGADNDELEAPGSELGAQKARVAYLIDQDGGARKVIQESNINSQIFSLNATPSFCILKASFYRSIGYQQSSYSAYL